MVDSLGGVRLSSFSFLVGRTFAAAELARPDQVGEYS